MKFEFSAGGIVYKYDSSTELGQGNLKILLAKHSYHKGWVFPKGLIENDKKETKEQAAVREVQEESGARAEIIEALEPVTYWYKFEEQKIKKTVYYFVMEYKNGDITKHDFEMEDVQWIESDKVLEKLTFKSDKQVFEKALPIIQSLVK